MAQLFAETEALSRDEVELQKLSDSLRKAVTRLSSARRVEAVRDKLQLLLQKTRTQLRQGHMALRQYLVEFGMTPGARSWVQAPEQPPNRAVSTSVRQPVSEFTEAPPRARSGKGPGRREAVAVCL